MSKEKTLNEAQEDIERHSTKLCESIIEEFEKEEDHRYATRIVIGYLTMTLLRVIRARIPADCQEVVIKNIEDYLMERIRES
jgi:hypothetical protein